MDRVRRMELIHDLDLRRIDNIKRTMKSINALAILIEKKCQYMGYLGKVKDKN